MRTAPGEAKNTPAYRPLNDVVNQIVWCENGSNVDTVLVNGEVVVEGGRLTKVDEMDVLKRAEDARCRIEPSMQRELAAARSMEPALAEMYFRVFGN